MASDHQHPKTQDLEMDIEYKMKKYSLTRETEASVRSGLVVGEFIPITFQRQTEVSYHQKANALSSFVTT